MVHSPPVGSLSVTLLTIMGVPRQAATGSLAKTAHYHPDPCPDRHTDAGTGR